MFSSWLWSRNCGTKSQRTFAVVHCPLRYLDSNGDWHITEWQHVIISQCPQKPTSGQLDSCNYSSNVKSCKGLVSTLKHPTLTPRIQRMRIILYPNHSLQHRLLRHSSFQLHLLYPWRVVKVLSPCSPFSSFSLARNWVSYRSQFHEAVFSYCIHSNTARNWEYPRFPKTLKWGRLDGKCLVEHLIPLLGDWQSSQARRSM
jgi:hypothetical protein